MTQSHQIQYTLAELISELPPELDAKIHGNPDCVIKGICTIQDAQPDCITFLVNPLYKKYLSTTDAAAVVLSASDVEECPVNAIISRDPYYTYARLAARFNLKSRPVSGIHPTAVIGKHCQIDPSASIGASVVIEKGVTIAANAAVGPGCVIGEYSTIDENTRLDANVTIYDRIKIGKHCQIASGVVIGSDGFGIAKYKGTWHKVPQLGQVIIGDYVEIGANTTIDRGAIDNTIIGKGVKIDNLIQIGHNVRIGDNTAIAGCVGIAGSAVIGKNCVLGGASRVAGHISIADDVVVTGGTEVSKSIRKPGIYSSGVGGLVTNMERRKNTARLHRLDHLIQRVKALENALTINSKAEGNES